MDFEGQCTMRRLVAICGFLVCVALVAVLVAGCTPQPRDFDGQRAYKHVLAQCALGPRPVGSPQGRQTADYVSTELRRAGWTVEVQDFDYRGVSARNLIAAKGRGPLFILGAHYDTRSLADRDPEDPTLPVPGANDGASGVAVLLELARVLDVDKAGVQVWLAFFDAEDQGGINGWPFSVGASYMAAHLAVQPTAVVVVDMVGDREQQILWEGFSDATLLRELWAIAADLGYEAAFVPQRRSGIMDDHVPFVQRGLVAVDIIDIDYPYWHTSQDTPDKVSAASLQHVGRVLEEWLEERP